jgi:hypothetical protein
MRKGLRRTAIVIGVLVVIGVAARLAAPAVAKRYVNRQLADMGEYRGTVSGVDLHLLAGGYVLRDVTIVEVGSANRRRLRSSLPWMSRFSGERCSAGRPSGEVVMHEPF